MRILIARHAQDIGSPADDKTRELTELGRTQVQKLGEVLYEFDPEVIICSSLRRSVETAELASSRLDVPIDSYSILDEMKKGESEPTENSKGFHKPTDTFQGGESFESLQGRVVEGWKLISEKYNSCEHIVIISHGRYMSYLINHILGHQAKGFNLAIENTSYLVFKVSERFRPQLVLPSPSKLYI